jgi:hypothetical protein
VLQDDLGLGQGGLGEVAVNGPGALTRQPQHDPCPMPLAAPVTITTLPA